MRINNSIKKLGIIAIAMILLISMSISASAAEMKSVCIGGVPFGVRFHTEGVTVAGLENVRTERGEVCPARDAGLSPGDVIIKMDGEKVSSAEEIVKRIASADGEIKLTYRHGGSERETKLVPARDERGNNRAGMWIRDIAAGIGTITFYDKESGLFAGLGHGICDAETGELIPLSHGIVTEVSLCGINRGASGAPGELKGYFGAEKIGEVRKNTRTGVYGVLTKLPRASGETVAVAKKKEVCEGDVIIRCTLADGDTKDYSAKISDIDTSGGECKNFIITVTDAELLRRTGGIVQGMSGSPILQNGKLIGAVTHVCVNL